MSCIPRLDLSGWTREIRGAREAYEVALQRTPQTPARQPPTWLAPWRPLACGDLTAARRWADEGVAVTKGVSLVAAAGVGARVEIASGEG